MAAWAVLTAAVSHFSMIGFPLPLDDQAMGTSIGAYAAECERKPLQETLSLCVIEDKSGAQLVIALDQKAPDHFEVFTLNPAIRGEGKTDIVIDADISPSEWKAAEVRVQAHFAEDETPLILDLADPREAPRFVKNAALNVDITAFADELSFYDDDRAYYASQKNPKMKFAANHFIPSGMFGEGDASHKPTAHAMFAGKILKMERRNNAIGKAGYWWFLVSTYTAAVVNVVADPSRIKRTPKVGDVIDGSFWLSARIASSR